MNTPKIYSLQQLLDADIDSKLCKLMLHQIKSPLLQHSFNMTTDDEKHGSPSGSFNVKQKKTKKYSPQQDMKDHQKLDSFTITNSYYETSRLLDNQPIVSPLQKQYFYAQSPLQNKQLKQNIYLNSQDVQYKQQSKEKQQKLVTFQKLQRKKNQSPKGNWCGNVFNSDLNENQVQVNLDLIKTFVRKKIFKKKKQQPKYGKISFKDASERLLKINQMEMYYFISFIGDTIILLKKLAPYKISLSLNHQTMCSYILKNNPVQLQFPQTLQNVKRIKNRLNQQKLSSVLMKYSIPIFQKDHQNKKNLVEHDIEFIIKILNEVQEKAQTYTSRKNIINQLQIIFEFLQQSFSEVSTLKQKIYRLLVSLQIDDDLIKVDELQYFWKQIQTPNYYTKHKFISQLCRNDLIIHENNNYHEHLKQLGYQRNI